MPLEEKEGEVQGVSLADQPDAQAIWDELDQADADGKTVDETAKPADTPGTDASSQGKAEDDTRPAAEEAADQTPEADPYKDLPPAVRDEIVGLKDTVGQLMGRLRNAEGHIGGLNNQLKQRMQAAAADVKNEGGDAPTKQQIAEAAESPEALKQLVEDYPEFGAAVKKVVDAQTARINDLVKSIQQQPKPQSDDTTQTIQALKDELIDVKISFHHKDWKKQVNDPGFDSWVARQPREVQALRYSDSPEDVVRLLDIKAAQAKAARQAEQNQDRASQQRQRNALRAAGIPAGRSSGTVQTKDLDDMTPEELWKHLDATEGAR